MPERLIPLLGMEGLLEQMKDHATVIEKKIKWKKKSILEILGNNRNIAKKGIKK